MFIWTTKIDRRKTALALGAAVLCALILAGVLLGTHSTATSAGAHPQQVRSAEDRLAYLSSWGWQAAESEVPVEELQLPKKFGPEYEQYLALQAEQGFDLTRCAGRRVRRYTYDILNDPSGEQNVQAHLLVCRNRVVAGEVLGEHFLRGLARPEPGAP